MKNSVIGKTVTVTVDRPLGSYHPEHRDMYYPINYGYVEEKWDNAPVSSGRLVQLCNEQLGWKKSTTYTAIKKLAQKGYLVNENAVVSVVIPRERVQHDESNYFVERTFGGSLPGFLTAFLGEKKISKKEADKIKKIIDSYSEK